MAQRAQCAPVEPENVPAMQGVHAEAPAKVTSQPRLPLCLPVPPLIRASLPHLPVGVTVGLHHISILLHFTCAPLPTRGYHTRLAQPDQSHIHVSLLFARKPPSTLYFFPPLLKAPSQAPLTPSESIRAYHSILPLKIIRNHVSCSFEALNARKN